MNEHEKEIAAGKAATAMTEKKLAAAGLSRPYYLKKLKALCEATKSDVPDNSVQLQAIRTVIDLYGDRAPVKSEITGLQNLTPTEYDPVERAARVLAILREAQEAQKSRPEKARHIDSG